MVNPNFQHHRPFVLTTEVTMKLTALHLLIPFHSWQRSLPILTSLSNAHIALQHKTQHVQNLHANITYTTISLNLLFGICYQHQVIEYMRLQRVWIILPYWFNWANEPLNISSKTTLSESKWLFHGDKFLISTLQYIILLRETYKFQKCNIIISMVSTDRCMMWGTYFYINQSTSFKQKNVFLVMATH